MESAQFSELTREAERLHHSGDCQGAIAVYDCLIDADPTNARLWYNRGIFRRDADDWSGALTDAEETLRLDPGELPARVLRAGCMEKLDRVAEAIGALDELIAAHPDYAPSYSARGRMLWECGLSERALESLTTYICLEPGDARGYALRGLTNKSLGDYTQARDDFTRALELEPDRFLVYS